AAALTYRLARRLFDRRAGVYAAFLAAFSPLLWWAWQEARMYTVLAVLGLVAALAWDEVTKDKSVSPQKNAAQRNGETEKRRGRNRKAAWFVLWASELALLYAHNTGPVIVLWLNGVTLFVWLSRRSFRTP